MLILIFYLISFHKLSYLQINYNISLISRRASSIHIQKHTQFHLFKIYIFSGIVVVCLQKEKKSKPVKKLSEILLHQSIFWTIFFFLLYSLSSSWDVARRNCDRESPCVVLCHSYSHDENTRQSEIVTFTPRLPFQPRLPGRRTSSSLELKTRGTISSDNSCYGRIYDHAAS